MKNLYRQTGCPVHYSDVAEELGISKWTAYDVMKQLNRLGMLDVRYMVKNDNMPGRSTVAFIPVEERVSSDEADWGAIQQRLLASIKEARREDRVRIIEEIIGEISRLDNSMLSCAYTIALVIINMDDELENEIKDNLKEIAKMKIKADLKLSMFIGIFLGHAIKAGKNKGVVQNIMQYISKFQSDISKVSFEEQDRLWKFALSTVK